MNIGEAAARAELPPKTIRYYESIGLIAPASRRASGYREYGAEDVQVLRFLRRARALGFTIDDCRELLDLHRDTDRASADVKAVAERHLADIDGKIAELLAMKARLERLVAQCRGDRGPCCAILDTLAGEERS